MAREFVNLIPELTKWNNGNGISLRAWMHAVGRYDQMLGFADIFWPDFYELHGCVFRNEPNTQNYEQWKTQCNGITTGIESLMNHLHLRDLLSSADFEPSNDMLRVLGLMLQEMWSCKLARDFPGRKFNVELRDGGNDQLEHIITFFQCT
jgi:hypothetical protein